MRLIIKHQPVSQGSMTPVVNRVTGKAWMRHQNGGAINKWRAAVREACKKAGVQSIDSGPVLIKVVFGVKRPANPTHTYPMGDLDKYVRALLDALTGSAYHDDSQVVAVQAMKDWGTRTIVEIETGFPNWVGQDEAESPSEGPIQMRIVW